MVYPIIYRVSTILLVVQDLDGAGFRNHPQYVSLSEGTLRPMRLRKWWIEWIQKSHL